MQLPIRRALLIHSQTPTGGFLPGVEKDVTEMKRFLKSPNGGAFQDHEIIELDSPTVYQVQKLVRLEVADYLFVYFSGHGFTRADQKRMICLTDGNLCDLDLLNNSRRQMVVIDACRTLERGAAIGGIKWPEEKWDYCTGYSEARTWFDQCIIQSPAGRMIVHATENNKAAFEALSGEGGQFTLALLDSIKEVQDKKLNGIVHIHNLLPYVCQTLEYRGVDQQPVIVLSEGALSVPLALVSPEFIYFKGRHSEPTEQEKNYQKLMVCGLFFLAALVISNKF